MINLKERTAKCQCGAEQVSDKDLAFFSFRGEGSKDATDSCGTCGYAEVAHTRAQELNEPHLAHCRTHEFTPHGAWEYDVFYCGCRGWD